MVAPGARGRGDAGARGASAAGSGDEPEQGGEGEDEEVRVLRGGARAAPERNDEFERELAALVLEHQGRAAPAAPPAAVRVLPVACLGFPSVTILDSFWSPRHAFQASNRNERACEELKQVSPAEPNGEPANGGGGGGGGGDGGGGGGGATTALRVVMRRGNRDDRTRELHVRAVLTLAHSVDECVAAIRAGVTRPTACTQLGFATSAMQSHAVWD